MATPTKAWSFVSLFIITLVLSLPFYTAQVYASPSVQITKNEGDDHLRQFIDAQGDTWVVEATITGTDAQTVNPQDVKIKIGNHERTFNTCSPGGLGIVCNYLSTLDRIQEAQYTFDVFYSFINNLGQPDFVSDSDVVKSDGTAPQITGLSASQTADGRVDLRFSVTDRVNQGTPFSGLKSIQILDGDTNEVLSTPANFALGDESYTYGGWEGFSGEAKDVFAGEGLKRIKVKATDRLNHETVSTLVSFRVDFIAPRIQENTLELVDLGRFIGSSAVFTDVTIRITETSDLSQGSVTAESLQAMFPNAAATCTDDPEQAGEWLCRWEDVQIQPEETIVFSITAIDRKGNAATKSITKSGMVRDVIPPRIEFLGTERIFEGRSYLRQGENKIIIRIDEEGSGISKENIRVNLGAFSSRTSQENPDECHLTEAGLTECSWGVQFSGSTDEMRIGVTKFQDNVGNEGSKPEVSFIVDNSRPIIEKLQIKAYSPIAGEHDYFQSNDVLKITFTATERSGIYVLVDESDAVMDAENKYPAGYHGAHLPEEDGIQVFIPEDGICQRDSTGEKWNCMIETDQLKSGPQDSVNLEIVIQDTAGNPAELDSSTPKFMKSGTNGRYQFTLLGLTDEEAPDFWELKKVLFPGQNYVDIDAAHLNYAVIPVEIQLKTDNSQVQAVSIDLVGCAEVEGETAPKLSERNNGGLLYASLSAVGDPAPKPKLILEFLPFDGRAFFNIPETEGTFTTATAKYTCQLRIFSKIGREAVRNVEFQEVVVEVPFGFTQLGAIDENLGQKIRELDTNILVDFAEAFDWLYKGIKWLEFISSFLSIITSITEIIAITQGALVVNAEVAEKTGILSEVGPAIRGTCATLNIPTEGSWRIARWMQIPAQILSCNPAGFDPGDPSGKRKTVPSALAWDSAYFWQSSVLDYYNVVSGRDLLGLPAQSVYENLPLSMVSLCLPGILYNAQKAREIDCRREVCYAREVPAGISTIDSCNQLYDLQMCEFVWGVGYGLFPIGQVWSHIGRLLKSIFLSPLSLISLAEIVACGSLCFVPGSGSALTTCRITTAVNKGVAIVNNIIYSINTRPSITSTPYCDMAEDIDLDELTTVGAS